MNGKAGCGRVRVVTKSLNPFDELVNPPTEATQTSQKAEFESLGYQSSKRSLQSGLSAESDE